MRSGETEKHCVTLFMSNSHPAGICLYRSRKRLASRFRLWILRMDELVKTRLRQLAFPEVWLIPLREVETNALRVVKPNWTRAEYCCEDYPNLAPD